MQQTKIQLLAIDHCIPLPLVNVVSLRLPSASAAVASRCPPFAVPSRLALPPIRRCLLFAVACRCLPFAVASLWPLTLIASRFSLPLIWR